MGENIVHLRRSYKLVKRDLVKKEN